MTRAQLYYATDTYCIWCWGFHAALDGFARAYADRIRLDVIPGGLYLDERVTPVGAKEGLLRKAERVSELTGAEFGPGFLEALRDGSTVLDSMVAARMFAALRNELGTGRSLEISHALQYAWFWDGRDLNDPAQRDHVAVTLGADPEAVAAHYGDPSSTHMAEVEFDRRRDLGITGYPALLLAGDDGLQQVAGPTASAERLGSYFEALLRGEKPVADVGDDRE